MYCIARCVAVPISRPSRGRSDKNTGCRHRRGPTDAAGGFVTGQTRDALAGQGVRIFDVLKDNDAYHALEACGGLLRTGATGTNVNDVAVLLIRP